MQTRRVTSSLLIIFLCLSNSPAKENSSSKTLSDSISELDQTATANQAVFIDKAKEMGHTAVPALKENLRHQNPEVKTAVLSALTAVKAPCEDVAADVAFLVNDPDKHVRHKAVYYLATQNCRSIKNRLKDRLATEPDTDLKRVITDSLGRIGSKSDVPTLLTIQNSPNEPMELRLTAARSLLLLNENCDIQLVKTSLTSANQNIISGALDVCEYSADQSLISLINRLVESQEPLKSQAISAWNAIPMNALPVPQRIEQLFALIQTDASKRTWSTNQLVYKYPDRNVIERLRTIAFDEENPATFEVMSMLDLAGHISREEMKHQMEKVYSQPHSH